MTQPSAPSMNGATHCRVQAAERALYPRPPIQGPDQWSIPVLAKLKHFARAPDGKVCILGPFSVIMCTGIAYTCSQCEHGACGAGRAPLPKARHFYRPILTKKVGLA